MLDAVAGENRENFPRKMSSLLRQCKVISRPRHIKKLLKNFNSSVHLKNITEKDVSNALQNIIRPENSLREWQKSASPIQHKAYFLIQLNADSLFPFFPAVAS